LRRSKRHLRLACLPIFAVAELTPRSSRLCSALPVRWRKGVKSY